MKLVKSNKFLRGVLAMDAATCIATGLLQLVATDLLFRWTGLATTLLVGSGWFLILYGAFVGALARSETFWSWLVPAIALANVDWGVGCLWLAAGNAMSITALGQAYVCVQAGTVFALAFLMIKGWRASSVTAANQAYANV